MAPELASGFFIAKPARKPYICVCVCVCVCVCILFQILFPYRLYTVKPYCKITYFIYLSVYMLIPNF